MSNRMQYAQLGVLVLIAVMGLVTMLAILPSPATPVTPVAQYPKAQPTSQSATNFTDLYVSGNIAATTGNITTLTATTIVSQAVGFDVTGNGTNSLPSYTFLSDPNTGLYRVGADDIGVTAGGVMVLDCTAAGCTNTGTLAVTGVETISAGTNSAPGLTFATDSNTGLYRVGADDIGMTAGGVKVFDCIATGCANTGTLASTGVASLNAGIAVDTSAFTVADVSGNVATAGTLNVTGASTLTGAVTVASDVTISPDTTGGNAGAKNELSGLPRIKFVSGAVGTNGTTETTSYTDDNSAGEYAPIDGDVTEAEGSGDGIYRIGTSSYKALFAVTAAENDGFKRTVANDDLEGDTSIGCWFYPSVTIASGDLQVLLTDDGGARKFALGAMTLGKWNWVEADITALAGGTGDAVTEFGVTLTAQGEGALGAFNLYMDGCWKWAAADEEALGTAILQDGVLSGFSIVDANTGVHTTIVLVENTDFFVHYESGSDFIVWITDQSAKSNTFLIAY